MFDLQKVDLEYTNCMLYGLEMKFLEMFMYFKFMFLGNWFCPGCCPTANDTSEQQDTTAELQAEVFNHSNIEVTKELDNYDLTENNQALEQSMAEVRTLENEKDDLLEKVSRQDQEIQKLNKINFDNKRWERKIAIGSQ